MRDDLEQQEQLDAIRGFWNDNKRWIVPFVSILVAAAVAFNLWNWYNNHRAVKASQALDALVLALAEQSLDKARVAHAALASDYGSTAQAAMGGLQMARVLASSGNLPEARSALEAVAKKAPAEFAWLAKIRLAGVMLDEENTAGALAAVSGNPPKALAPLVLDRRGDVYMAMGQKENARTAWKAALEGLASQSPTHALVLRKLQTIDSFGG
jgi:predicted negative regulator of RcsB-dependent stress response